MRGIKAFLTLVFVVGAYCNTPLLSFSLDKIKTFELSLDGAIKTAYSNNKQLQIAEQDIKIAKAGILGAKSQFLPDLTVSGSYTYNDAVMNPFGSMATGRKDPSIFFGYKNDNQAQATVQEKFYDGGADIAGLKQARTQYVAEIETVRASKLDIEFETKRLFYGLLLALETERITRELYDNAKAHYLDVTNKYVQGTVSKFSLLQSKVQVSKIMPELVKAQNSVEVIDAELKKLLGIDMKDTLILKGKLVADEFLLDEEAFVLEAYKNNPEVIVKSLGIDVSKWAIDIAQAGLLPSVYGVFNYSVRSDDVGNMINPRHSLWSLGIKGSIAIFDGFYTKSKVDQARAMYAQSFLSKADLLDRIRVDIRKGCLDLKKADAILGYEKDNIGEAKEALRLARVGFDNGVNTNLDILDAELSLSQIERDYAGGIYDHLMAKAFLERTMGRGLKENNV